MKYLTRLDPIEKLDFSARAYNALRRAGIDGVGDLLDFPKENFPSLKNMGAKSVSEITEVIEQIKINEIDPLNCSADQKAEGDLVAWFIGKDGTIVSRFAYRGHWAIKEIIQLLKRSRD